MNRSTKPAGEVVPSYGWFGEQYRQVWRVIVNGREVGLWSKPRWARQDLRYHLRRARRGA